MRRATRTLADTYQARFSGTRWTIALRGEDWKRFCALPLAVNSRLTAILEHFCEHGDSDLPRGSFAWLARTASDPPDVMQGAFEAHRVVIYGRRATAGSENSFFVTEVVADLPADPACSPKPRGKTNPRQGRLPLGE